MSKRLPYSRQHFLSTGHIFCVPFLGRGKPSPPCAERVRSHRQKFKLNITTQFYARPKDLQNQVISGGKKMENLMQP